MVFKKKRSILASRTRLTYSGRFTTNLAKANDRFPIRDSRLRYRDSIISGVGIFAKPAMAFGDKIIEYEGEFLTPDEYTKTEQQYKGEFLKSSCFLKLSSDRGYIDATFKGNASRYVNHSCEPNCEAIEEGDTIVFYACKDIPPNTEITVDYGDVNADNCLCGSPNCRYK